MERINIAEILRESPRGMELDSPCFENVVFDRIDDKGRIRCLSGDRKDEVSFTAYGCLNECPSAKRVLFPKGEKDWGQLVKKLKKFDIRKLKPFDKVLVRDNGCGMWCASIFSHLWRNKYFCVGVWYNCCIPYEGNEHLLGTTDDCDEYYKTWEDWS